MSHVNQPNPTEQALSPTLSILPLKNRVLLPSGAMKLTLTRPRDVALVDHALASGNVASGSLFVGVVPLRRDEGLDTESGTASALGGDLPDDVVDLRERLHDVGVAARIVQVARTENRGGGTRAYTLLLEGRCRFELSRLVSVDPFLVASVTQLDSLSTGSLTDNAGTSQGVSSLSPVDAELAAMAASFKLRARELVDKLEQRKGHARRLKSMLTNAPAHRIADLFVAAFEDDFENRIELLAMTCPKQRMAASLALIEKQLTSLRVNADVARRVQGKLSKTQREFILRQQMAAIKKELGEGRDDNKDEEGDLDVLLAKVRVARFPNPSTGSPNKTDTFFYLS
jgi:ATP-dependent Lon protease